VAEPKPDEQHEEERSPWAAKVSKNLTSMERVERDQALVAYRLRNPSKNMHLVGQYFGITGRGANKVWARWKNIDRSYMQQENPVDVIHEHIAGFKELREDAARLAMSKYDAVALGALRLIADLRSREIALRQETGLLPHDLGTVKLELDLRFLMEKVIEVLERNQVPREEIAELIAVLDGEVTASSIIEAAPVDEEDE
jgi:hypothetical protein